MDTKKRLHARRSRAERDEVAAAWRASGKSVPAFAAEHGLASSTLYQWIHPPTKRAVASSSATKDRKRSSSAKAKFAEVNVVGQAAARRKAMTVALRGGDSVTFEGEAVDVARLEAVLKVLRAC